MTTAVETLMGTMVSDAYSLAVFSLTRWLYLARVLETLDHYFSGISFYIQMQGTNQMQNKGRPSKQGLGSHLSQT